MRRSTFGTLVLALVLPACAGGQGTALSQAERPKGDLLGLHAGSLATLVQTVVPQWEPGPDGRPMVDEYGENPYPLEAPAQVVVEELRTVEAVPWLRVYVLPDQSRGAADFFTWLPGIAADGNVTVSVHGTEECPADASVEAIAAISYLARARCLGDAQRTLEGVTWFGGDSDYFEVAPSWLGADFERPSAVALHATRDERGFALVQTPWLNVSVPPSVDPPPRDFLVRITGQFNHPDAAGCTRIVSRGIFGSVPPNTGLTDSTPEESDQWCRGHFVVTGWEALTGPEGQPIQAGVVQLHRTPWEDGMCAGVGMDQLVFRIDPTQTDPIWLETLSGAAIGHPGFFRIMPVFGAGFRVRTDPELVVLAPAPDDTVVAHDGQLLNPDAPLFGYAVCPMGEVVSITAP